MADWYEYDRLRRANAAGAGGILGFLGCLGRLGIYLILFMLAAGAAYALLHPKEALSDIFGGKDEPELPAGQVYLARQHLASGASFKPEDFTLSEDTNDLLVFSSLDWDQWSDATAHAAGAGAVQKPPPGPDLPAPDPQVGDVQITLSAPADRCGQRFFTRIEIYWPAGRPGGGPARQSIPQEVACY
ncbi:MAG: hypothetical protein JNL54_07215 [Kineosporiaceae bacterium]|nr:hypothetical protein [Kineosporiaceae bacterium]